MKAQLDNASISGALKERLDKLEKAVSDTKDYEMLAANLDGAKTDLTKKVNDITKAAAKKDTVEAAEEHAKYLINLAKELEENDIDKISVTPVNGSLSNVLQDVDQTGMVLRDNRLYGLYKLNGQEYEMKSGFISTSDPEPAIFDKVDLRRSMMKTMVRNRVAPQPYLTQMALCFGLLYSFKPKTRSPEGLLFFAATRGGQSHLALYMSKGRIRLSVGKQKEIFNREKYNDGKWHSVVFSLEKKKFRLVVDGIRAQDGQLTSAELKSMQHFLLPVYLGSPPESLQKELKMTPLFLVPTWSCFLTYVPAV
ncbi:hypothetical protein GOODEAATRI_003828 [Goodea atripinnis]|uniref:Laminin G domain-containing protein n=1 Tax=Goodea atripinnis TaxID=208336 RepID=A0ABV0PB47_9TELE